MSKHWVEIGGHPVMITDSPGEEALRDAQDKLKAAEDKAVRLAAAAERKAKRDAQTRIEMELQDASDAANAELVKARKLAAKLGDQEAQAAQDAADEADAIAASEQLALDKLAKGELKKSLAEDVKARLKEAAAAKWEEEKAMAAQKWEEGKAKAAEIAAQKWEEGKAKAAEKGGQFVGKIKDIIVDKVRSHKKKK